MIITELSSFVKVNDAIKCRRRARVCAAERLTRGADRVQQQHMRADAGRHRRRCRHNPSGCGSAVGAVVARGLFPIFGDVSPEQVGLLAKVAELYIAKSSGSVI
jgi:hypothetical protein